MWRQRETKSMWSYQTRPPLSTRTVTSRRSSENSERTHSKNRCCATPPYEYHCIPVEQVSSDIIYLFWGVRRWRGEEVEGWRGDKSVCTILILIKDSHFLLVHIMWQVWTSVTQSDCNDHRRDETSVKQSVQHNKQVKRLIKRFYTDQISEQNDSKLHKGLHFTNFKLVTFSEWPGNGTRAMYTHYMM